ncbi:ArsC/Spx/MgsR family protein [Candidatus Nitrosotenuis chungbukensis]|uniref:arsenate reductase family protein n=1 Tax=Candidatus Nitrosotenuis chungbukensis TaxID=1353246 RepID=UPI0005B2E445|nr:ArsC/Spx/MgsR family protein [Candidatus Nitrosotenuis chungbukensis]WKT58500.1 ArsC/Spx/MgsR family protein [Candidatus Nitrosotenuis chungbukensis]
MKIYLKPTCITCRRAVTELDRLKLDVQKRDIFKDKLTESEIKKIIQLTGIKPRDLIRKKDKMFKELHLDDSRFTDSQIIKILSEHPGLIRRPIVFAKNKILIGKFDSKELKH